MNAVKSVCGHDRRKGKSTAETNRVRPFRSRIAMALDAQSRGARPV